MLALGVDVGEHFLDVVALDDGRQLPRDPLRCTAAEFGAVLTDIAPSIVAIDCPCTWSVSGGRACEAALAAARINIFHMPTEEIGRDHKFYRWVLHGMAAYDACYANGFKLFRDGAAAPRDVMEVFPHASTVALRGSIPRMPTPAAKKRVRDAVLRANGVADERLKTIDQIDAALAALTGLLALAGNATAVGKPDEGVIVVPTRNLPAKYAREAG